MEISKVGAILICGAPQIIRSAVGYVVRSSLMAIDFGRCLRCGKVYRLRQRTFEESIG